MSTPMDNELSFSSFLSMFPLYGLFQDADSKGDYDSGGWFWDYWDDLEEFYDYELSGLMKKYSIDTKTANNIIQKVILNRRRIIKQVQQKTEEYIMEHPKSYGSYEEKVSTELEIRDKLMKKAIAKQVEAQMQPPIIITDDEEPAVKQEWELSVPTLDDH